MKKGILVHYINIDHIPIEYYDEYRDMIIDNIIGDKNDPENQVNYWDNIFHFVIKQDTQTQVIRTDNQLDIDNLDIELISKIKQVIIEHENCRDNRPKELLHEAEEGQGNNT